ncbi:MAG: hypothetical protein HFJ60_09460 [Clostridia bacterium]|nr:hypothetical protein [Clostridia bacterium]
MEETYKVLKIIDIENILINAGKENYIKKGDKFEIFVRGDEVIDESTKKSLGTLDTIKDIVTVVAVFPKMCICQKLIKTSIPSLAAFAKEQLSFKSEPISLNVDKTQITGGFSNDLVIRVGDLARLTE